ncbi:cytochrome bd-I ubiquinol oxidase subunit 2 apoprotein [Cupriavidus gilardii J11]|uniref:Cytochrome bd-I ubiquinol oxidase subunit 2 apoprotein n=1 Tax=Cupriavidus gilardii J11 TaxID=936133 RepID=A0A562B9K8_9BURK|nr:cytochrome d ubiquinol oxidase subunit II [Cupriavidus gilardii]TWG81876.1 cytochrome bd-I ubiquinol oxidase subunit 2 apoprotein [Cupriavidus gilardii J11]
MTDLSQPAGWMPLVFLALMGLSMLIYVILDGYDLGVGVLLRRADDDDKDRMIASIGPFWDANETWLVLGVGLLLTAFPIAHGVILTALYIPVALMLAGLILRGVAFDFRVKARAHHKPWWNRAFYAGSLLASFSQGLMLGRYVTGFEHGWLGWAFAVLVGLGLVAGYCLLGASWLIMKTTGPLQLRAMYWGRRCLWLTGVGVAAISVATPLVSERIFDKWFSLPNIILLAPIPLITIALFIVVDRVLRRMPAMHNVGNDRWAWVPFVSTAVIFLMAFNGLAYSLFPYLVVDRLDIWQAASAPESLAFILVGAVIVLPTILGYTIFAYRVFWGKATDLHYY